MSNPTVRLALRAVIAGILAFAASVQAAADYGAETWVTAVLAGLVSAGLLAGAELGTPLNQTVGLGKEQPAGGGVGK